MTPRLALLVFAAAIAADTPLPIKVIRVAPTGDADPATIVTVTFDRPVAGSLDRTVDPRTALVLEPQLRQLRSKNDPAGLEKSHLDRLWNASVSQIQLNAQRMLSSSHTTNL